MNIRGNNLCVDPDGVLRQLFDTAVYAASHFPDFADRIPRVNGRVLVVGAGKAAYAMAKVLERRLPDWLDESRLFGFIVQPDPACPKLRILDVLSASHPVPDENSVIAGDRPLRLASTLVASDRLVALVSGGGSALLCSPGVGVTLSDKIDRTRLLLQSGRPIAELNEARASLSPIKVGGLADAAAPVQVVTFLVSDVPGDCLARVASGPTLRPGR